MTRQHIQELIASAHSLARERDGDAVLFLGNPTDAIPRALFVDTDLPFAARVLWCFLRSLSDSPGSAGISPSYRELQKELGISNRAAVGDYLKILQITRWITVVSQGGTNARRVYILHALPLTFDHAMEMDPGYAEGIEKAMQHGRPTIRALAQRILDGAIRSSEYQAPGSDIYRLAGFAQGQDTDSPGGVSMWSGIFQRGRPDAPGEEPHPPPAIPAGPEHVDPDIDLDFHDRFLDLSPSMKELAGLTLKRLPVKYRQLLLDDLAANVIDRASGNDPIRSPLRYLQWMVNQYKEGGELPLSGKGENLKEIVRAKDRKQYLQDTSPLRVELQTLRSHAEQLERMVRRSGDDPMNEGMKAVKGVLDDNRAKIKELERELREGRNDD